MDNMIKNGDEESNEENSESKLKEEIVDENSPEDLLISDESDPNNLNSDTYEDSIRSTQETETNLNTEDTA